MKARIEVFYKAGVLDPEAKAVGRALGALGFDAVTEIRQGKVIELSLAVESEEEARHQAEAMCEKLLANPVMERYRIDLIPD
ncbi:hypothetical protein PB2503_10444 [Parvularcula bermudensis HTCC2503]|uniref:Phosphoribosylformylglycinamidine synthase subunit PurS n=1 Tax=Parvularcula bermudensis (strain ATCC BAA-594 / HTCC2503 / KCTC 12087) TaxID=314260 RepID=E0TGK8_PARBH|nr:phosphoribosylformylglycinamidine synthase subunit PurS [Parvularcula bermudensis]ADM10140.1 hypothetical protein PB2503_10444 [Parvularcula bermudensis HTCC2503]